MSARTIDLLRSLGLEEEVRAGQLDIGAVGAWAAAAATVHPAFPLEVHTLDHPVAAALGLTPDGAVLARPDAQVVTCWPTAPPDPGAGLAEALTGWSARRPTATAGGRRPSSPPAGGSRGAVPEAEQPGQPLSSDRTLAAWPSALTLCQARSMRPFSSTRKVERRTPTDLRP